VAVAGDTGVVIAERKRTCEYVPLATNEKALTVILYSRITIAVEIYSF